MSYDLQIRPYQSADREAIVELWRLCDLVVPWNDPHRDIERKLRVDPKGLLVGEISGRLIASVMAGYDGHRGWINYLAVHPDVRGRGFGRTIMNRAEERLRNAGAAKINLQVRTSNTMVIEFYRSIGYQVDDVVSMGKRLVRDERVAGTEESPRGGSRDLPDAAG